MEMPPSTLEKHLSKHKQAAAFRKRTISFLDSTPRTDGTHHPHPHEEQPQNSQQRGGEPMVRKVVRDSPSVDPPAFVTTEEGDIVSVFNHSAPDDDDDDDDNCSASSRSLALSSLEEEDGAAVVAGVDEGGAVAHSPPARKGILKKPTVGNGDQRGAADPDEEDAERQSYLRMASSATSSASSAMYESQLFDDSHDGQESQEGQEAAEDDKGGEASFRGSSAVWDEMIEKKMKAKRKKKKKKRKDRKDRKDKGNRKDKKDESAAEMEFDGGKEEGWVIDAAVILPSSSHHDDNDDDDDKDDEHCATAVLAGDRESTTSPTKSPREEEPSEEAQKEKRRKRSFLLLSLLLLLLLIIIFGLVFGLKGDGGGDDPDAAGSGVADGPREDGAASASPSPPKPWWLLDTDATTITKAPQGRRTTAAPTISIAPSTMPPSNEPTVLMEETTHPVKLMLENVPLDALTVPMRDTVVDFIKEIFERNLDNSIELVDVVYDAEIGDGRRGRNLLRSSPSEPHENTRRLEGVDALSLPLLITVKGPARESGLHLLYVVQVLQCVSNELGTYLKSLEGNAFADVAISLESDSIELDGVADGAAPACVPPATAPSPVANLPAAGGDEVAVDPGAAEQMTLLDPTTSAPTAAAAERPTTPTSTSSPPGPGTAGPTGSDQFQAQFEACDADVRTCDGGTTVVRNPFQTCDFFPCPEDDGGSTTTTTSPSGSTTTDAPTAGEFATTEAPVGASPPIAESPSTPLPTTPSPVSAPPTPRPTTMTPRPTTIRPTTPRPTTARPTMPRPTTARPTTPLPTDSPSLHPTTATSLLCSPDPPPLDASSCQSETATTTTSLTLTLLEKCASSDTVADDLYGNALAVTTADDGVYAVVGARQHSVSGSAYLISYDGTSRRWDHVAEFVPGGASANGGFDGTEAASSYDQFGWDVAISHEWVAISAPFHVASTGRVSLFRLGGVRNGDRTEPDAELVAQDGRYSARFGSSVAVDGDTLVVGAAGDRDNVGSAYVFRLSGGAWTQAAKLAPDDASSDSQGNFGSGVAVLALGGGGAVVVVGAPYDGTNGRRRNGSAYVYASSGPSGPFALVQKIVPSELLGGDQFGSSVAVDAADDPSGAGGGVRETRIAVGARLRDDRGGDSGSVYVYVRQDDEGEFSFVQKLTPSQWSPGADMGTSLDMHGNKLIVGANKRDGPGGAHYFQYDGATWVERGVLTPPSNGAGNDNGGDDYGAAVALTSDVALVGSYSHDEFGEDGGTMYSYAVCN